MSGIFDLFGGTAGNAAKSQSLSGPTEIVKKSATTTIFSGGAMAGKSAVLTRPKPRGLSIRSGNDLNISALNIQGSKSPLKKSPVKSLLKPAQFNELSKQLSPGKKTKTLKMQILKSKQLKAGKTKSPNGESVCERRQNVDSIFKKPMTPKYPSKNFKVYREPEMLGRFYDFEKDLNDFELDRGFSSTVHSVKPYEDEGFESDPERARTPSPLTLPTDRLIRDPLDDLPSLELPELPTSPTDRLIRDPLDDLTSLELPELPALSDDDDFLD